MATRWRCSDNLIPRTRCLGSSYHAPQIGERTVIELLERQQPLDHLSEHLRHAASGHGRLVLVGGEAGVGKTTLVEAFCRQAAGTATALRTSWSSSWSPTATTRSGRITPFA